MNRERLLFFRLTDKQQAVFRILARAEAQRMPPPTVREIAALLNLRSPNSVMNHLKALERSGYIQRSGKSRSIRVLKRFGPAGSGRVGKGAISPVAVLNDDKETFTYSYPSEVLSGITTVLSGRRMPIFPMTLGCAAPAIAAEIRKMNCGGVILFCPQTPDALVSAIVKALPCCVVIEPPMPGQGINQVTPDHAGGAQQAAAYLLSNGRRRVGFAGRWRFPRISEERAFGWRMAHLAAGLKSGESLVWDLDKAHSLEDIANMCAGGKGVDGIVCFDDPVARRVVDALLAAGVAVPDEIAVVGINDDAHAVERHPYLTTMRNDGFEVGRLAAERLLSVLDGNGKPAEIRVPMRLIVRESA